MARTPKLPNGVSVYPDLAGNRKFWRVRLGAKFLGKGRKPEKRAFSSHAEAVNWIKERQAELHPCKADAEKTRLTESQIDEAKVAIARLLNAGGEGVSLVDAADAWIRHVLPTLRSETVSNAIAKLIEAKARKLKSERSKRHLAELKNKLKRIFRTFETEKMAAIEPKHFETMLYREDAKGNPPSDSQIVKRARYAKILFRYSTAQGWMANDKKPFAGVELPELIGDEVVVLSPALIARLLWNADQKYPLILPALAIKIFSGIRQTELYRLNWERVDNDQITVIAAHSKTGRKRAITIPPTLAEWLKICRKDSGPVFDCEPQRKDRVAVWYSIFGQLQKSAGITEWPQNALRHTFGSYHYALHKNENLTAAEMGNSPAIVKANYINAPKKQETLGFWRLIPGVAEAVAQTQIEDDTASFGSNKSTASSELPCDEYVPPFD